MQDLIFTQATGSFRLRNDTYSYYKSIALHSPLIHHIHCVKGLLSARLQLDRDSIKKKIYRPVPCAS